jgi:hypothetical protein
MALPIIAFISKYKKLLYVIYIYEYPLVRVTMYFLIIQKGVIGEWVAEYACTKL